MEVLLVSVDSIKTYSNISENTADKYIYSAIIDAQQIELKSILGDDLLNNIYDQVKTGQIVDKELLDDYIQPFLIRQVSSDIIIPIAYKIGNIGVAQASDTNLASSQLKEISFIKDYYLNKANVAKKSLQDYLVANKYKADNTSSSSSCGIWLGGARGKHLENSLYKERNCSHKDLSWICY